MQHGIRFKRNRIVWSEGLLPVPFSLQYAIAEFTKPKKSKLHKSVWRGIGGLELSLSVHLSRNNSVAKALPGATAQEWVGGKECGVCSPEGLPLQFPL